MEPSSPPKLPARKPRLGRPYRILLSLGVLFVAVVFIFPLILEPGIEPPADVLFGNPSSIAVQIANRAVTPLEDVTYTCEISQLTLAEGSAVADAKVLTRGTIRKAPGRRSITARCRTAYLVAAPLKAAAYTLTLTYRTFPWPQRRTSVYRIAAQINGSGRVTGWKVN